MPRRRRAEADLTDSDWEERPARNAANARERARMRVLSRAFSRLKTTLPWVPPDTKLSKLDTLRLATSYIAHLSRVLGTSSQAQASLPHPITFSWPFTIPGGGQLTPAECPINRKVDQMTYNQVPYESEPMLQMR